MSLEYVVRLTNPLFLILEHATSFMRLFYTVLRAMKSKQKGKRLPGSELRPEPNIPPVIVITYHKLHMFRDSQIINSQVFLRYEARYPGDEVCAS